MTVIPIICQTCRAVCFVEGLFGIVPDCTIIVKQSTTNPCPACGGICIIPDGTYEAARIVLDNPVQYELVVTAIQEIQRLIAANVPPELIAETIDKKYPFLGYLKRFLPKDLKDLVIVVGCLGALFQYMKPGPEIVPQPKPEIHAQKKVVDAARDISEKLQTSQRHSPQRPPKRYRHGR